MSDSRWHGNNRCPPADGAQGNGPRVSGADSGSGRRSTGLHQPPRRTPPRWGGLTGGRGVCIVLATVALGTVITIQTGRQPGLVLGVLLIAGTLAGTLCVQPRVVYLIIPVPALAYVVAAAVAGLIHDRSADTSSTAVALNATQWIASGFRAITIATLLAMAVTAIRWKRSNRAGSSRRQQSACTPPPRRLKGGTEFASRPSPPSPPNRPGRSSQSARTTAGRRGRGN